MMVTALHCGDAECWVPVAHTHRPPTAEEIEESEYLVAIVHPSHCAWRKDIYDGCSCGVTGAVTELEDLMREKTSRPRIFIPRLERRR